MAKNKNGLSPEFVIHPGETLKEIIEDRGMSQKEVAARTGVSEKHISNVVNCIKPISVAFAKKLEYVFEVEAKFWINLQSNYDNELADIEDINNISKEELTILKNLKKIIKHLVDMEFMEYNNSPIISVINLRKLLNISSLESIPDIISRGAYRVADIKSTNPYVIFTWLRMCELYTKDIEVGNNLDIKLLKSFIPDIKKIMFCNPSEIHKRLENIFSQCGIKFAIVPHFTGAPIQGVISYDRQGDLSLIMTIRQKYADIFWFTLFHEIGHIINGDIKKQLIDYSLNNDPTEIKADEFAKNILIEEYKYLEFINKGDFSLENIKSFSKTNNIQPYILIGRLQKDKIIDYSIYHEEKVRYEWA